MIGIVKIISMMFLIIINYVQAPGKSTLYGEIFVRRQKGENNSLHDGIVSVVKQGVYLLTNTTFVSCLDEQQKRLFIGLIHTGGFIAYSGLFPKNESNGGCSKSVEFNICNKTAFSGIGMRLHHFSYGIFCLADSCYETRDDKTVIMPKFALHENLLASLFSINHRLNFVLSLFFTSFKVNPKILYDILSGVSKSQNKISAFLSTVTQDPNNPLLLIECIVQTIDKEKDHYSLSLRDNINHDIVVKECFVKDYLLPVMQEDNIIIL